MSMVKKISKSALIVRVKFDSKKSGRKGKLDLLRGASYKKVGKKKMVCLLSQQETLEESCLVLKIRRRRISRLMQHKIMMMILT